MSEQLVAFIQDSCEAQICRREKQELGLPIRPYAFVGCLCMNYAHARNADLNLLVALRFLVEERSVTRAARRMFLTQPAMSRVVDRLQIMFEDQLLVRTTKGYEPTHRALTIYAELQQVLPELKH